MPAQDGMGALPSHGKGGTLQVSHGPLQDAFLHRVSDWQLYADLVDFDITHNAIPGGAQKAHIPSMARLIVPCLIAGSKAGIVGMGLYEHLLNKLRVHLLHPSSIAVDRPGLMEGVPPVADGWVRHQPYANQQDQEHQNRSQFLLNAAQGTITPPHTYSKGRTAGKQMPPAALPGHRT